MFFYSQTTDSYTKLLLLHDKLLQHRENDFFWRRYPVVILTQTISFYNNLKYKTLEKSYGHKLTYHKNLNALIELYLAVSTLNFSKMPYFFSSNARFYSPFQYLATSLSTSYTPSKSSQMIRRKPLFRTLANFILIFSCAKIVFFRKKSKTKANFSLLRWKSNIQKKLKKR